MVSLYPHQSEAIEKLKTGSILCGGVGSGKSRTSLAYFLYKDCKAEETIENVKEPKDLYIITTARKRDTKEWEAECAPFGLHTERQFSLSFIKVTIDSWNNIKKYANVKDAFFIFDEQRVVGYGAWVKNFLKIAKSNHWILLTATPGDTWSDYIPVFVANGFYKNKTEFNNRHAVFSRFSKFPKIDKYVETKHLEELRASIMVDMTFERKTVQHHERIDTNYDISKYNLIMKKRWNPYTNEPIQDVAGLCYLLRRVSNESEDRLNALSVIIEDHPKAIVFYNFNYELDAIKERFGSVIEISEWNGHKHEPVPSSQRWLYLVQYTAGAEGWNCTVTDTIVFYSQNYSYKIMIQSAGRIDRMNTPFTDLYYYHLRSTSKIDLAISKALREKKTFNEKAFAGSHQ